MKVNENFLSIPPYLSVGWHEVSALSVVDDTLVVQLRGGKTIPIPNLPPEAVMTIFDYHIAHIQRENLLLPPFPAGRVPTNPFAFDPSELLDIPIAFKIGTPEGVISAIAHNPIQSNAPSLPQDLLEKICSITKNIGINFQGNLPQNEPKCNCYFCQIMSFLHMQVFLEQEVTHEDLKFREWAIQETGDNLFSVENPLNAAEKYSVYLGHPVGCSCGKEGCEHLIAVLKS